MITLLHLRTVAQQLKPALKDSLPAKAVIKSKLPTFKTPDKLPLEVTVEKELATILSAYTSQPNTAATWVQVKAAAENVLLTHFLNGKLQGAKAGHAFYIKMGTETMTAADIANKKMILIAGIATVKPAEFTVIRIEKKCLL